MTFCSGHWRLIPNMYLIAHNLWYGFMRKPIKLNLVQMPILPDFEEHEPPIMLRSLRPKTSVVERNAAQIWGKTVSYEVSNLDLSSLRAG